MQTNLIMNENKIPKETLPPKGYRRYKPVHMQINIKEEDLLNKSHLSSLRELNTKFTPAGDGVYITEMIYDGILPAFGGEFKFVEFFTHKENKMDFS